MCGSKKYRHFKQFSVTEWGYECGKCGLSTGKYQNKEEAIVAWNSLLRKEDVEQVKRERDWLAHHFDQKPCKRDNQCAHEIQNRNCTQSSKQCWIDAAKCGVEAAKEAVCQKK